MRCLIHTVFVILAAAFCHASDPPPRAPESWHVGELLADRAGGVWGLLGKPDDNEDGTQQEVFKDIAQYSGPASQWQIRPHPDIPADAHAEGLAALADGGMACLWRSGTHSYLTMHRDGLNKFCRTLKTTFIQPRLLALSDGSLIITESGTRLARIAAGGSSAVLSRIPLELTNISQADTILPFEPTQAVECSDGSVCLWSNALPRQDGRGRLNGLLRWTHETIKPVPGKPLTMLSAVVAGDKDDVWAAEWSGGLTRIHWPDGKADAFEPPSADFAYIQNLAMLHGSLHVVTCPPVMIKIFPGENFPRHSSRLPFHQRYNYNLGRRTGTLWQIKDGKATALIEDLDASHSFGWPDRPLLATDQGLLVGAKDNGPWWLPAGAGKPFRLDPSQGCKLGEVAAILPVGKEGLIARSTGNLWSVLPLPGDQPKAPNTRASTLFTRKAVLQDSRLHLWAFRVKEDDLGEWDGHEWHSHPFGRVLKSIDDLEFAPDAHDHGWLIPYDGGQTPVLDFATGVWHMYDTLEQAVEQKLAPGDQVHMRARRNFSPVSHVNGSKAFVDIGDLIHFYHQGKWSNEDPLRPGGGRGTYSGPPGFDSAGHLSVLLGSGRFTRGEDGIWARDVNADLRPSSSFEAENHSLPKDWTGQPGSVAYDRFGVAWISTHNGELWKWLDGISVRVLDQDGSDPLPPASALQQVFIDPAHNAFLRHHGEPIPLDKIAAGPLPAMPPFTIDMAAGVIHQPAEPGLWHRWRIDNEPWHKLVPQGDIKLEALSPGPHQVDIHTFNAELTPIDEIQSLALPFPGQQGLAHQPAVPALGPKAVVSPTEPAMPASKRLVELHTRSFIVQDLHNRHLWALRAKEGDLAEWDGHEWHSHGSPKELEGVHEIEFAADAHSHGWMIPKDSGRTPVLDFQTEEWHVFNTLEQAVAESLEPGDRVFMHRDYAFGPVSHASGGKGFAGYDNVIHVLNNGAWIRVPGKELRNFDPKEPFEPFFDRAGVFCLPTGEDAESRYEFRDPGPWVEHQPPNPNVHSVVVRHPTLYRDAPLGCPVQHVCSRVYERAEIAWMVTETGEIWKWLGGVAAKISDHDTPVLLPPGSHVDEVRLDLVGNAFLRLDSPGETVRYAMLSVRPPPAMQPATVVSAEAGTAIIRLSPAPGIWYRWRLENTPWNTFVHQTAITLEGLSVGQHTLRIDAFDEELNRLGPSQMLEITLEPPSTENTLRLIQRLQSADLATREAAARVLEAQGDISMPALQHALKDPRTDATLQWWLTAVVQHIETQDRKGKKK